MGHPFFLYFLERASRESRIRATETASAAARARDCDSGGKHIRSGLGIGTQDSRCFPRRINDLEIMPAAFAEVFRHAPTSRAEGPENGNPPRWHAAALVMVR